MKGKVEQNRRPAPSRPRSSLSVRLISRKIQGGLEIHGECLYGKSSPYEAGNRRDVSPSYAENQYYTVKYVGITNGELGVLSQRKPLLSPKNQYRTFAQGPLTPQVRTTSEEAGEERIPEEFVRPKPEKYDEFIVHKYSRPRPLTASRRERGPSPLTPNWCLEGSKCGTPTHDVRPAKIERKGVSGWKLAWSRPTSSLPIRFRPKLPVSKSPKPSQVLEHSPNYVCGEAYLHYVLQMKAGKT